MNITYYMEMGKFPSGELDPKLSSDIHLEVHSATVNARLNNSDDIMALLFTVDALRRAYGVIEIKLFIYKMPYAQQDRICNDGEAHCLAVVAKQINSLGAKQVTICDPHSNVTEALIENLVVISQYDIFSKVYPSWGNKVLVAPDAGSQKKVFSFAKRVGAGGVIFCDKIRDLGTNRIIRSVLNADASEVEGKELVILDDICLKGGTFLALAGMLLPYKPKSMDLVVTHGVFNDNALPDLLRTFDNIHTTNSYNVDLVSDKNLFVIKK
jgi:ribose-phosphate pyrophosphokinase